MSKEDIVKYQFDNRTAEEQHEIAVSGGIASGETRRRKKAFKEELIWLLETEKTNKETGETKTIQTIGLENIMKKFMAGDLQTFLAVRDTIGEKPVEKVEQELVSNIKVDVTDE